MDPVFLGNGTLALYSEAIPDKEEVVRSAMSINRCVLCVPSREEILENHALSSIASPYLPEEFAITNGGLGMTVEVFTPGEIRVLRRHAGDVKYERRRGSLREFDMTSAVMRVEHTATDLITGRPAATLRSEVRALRQFPYCSLESFDIRTPFHEIDIFHGVRPPSGMINTRYSPSVTSRIIESVSPSTGRTSKSGPALVARIMSCSGVTAQGFEVETSCCYLLSDPDITITGISVSANDPDNPDDTVDVFPMCSMKLVRTAPTEEHDADVIHSARVHVLTCTITRMSGSGGANLGSTRILVGALTRYASSATTDSCEEVARAIIRDHESQWSFLWDQHNGGFHVVPYEKEEDEQKQESNVSRLNHALYVMLSSVRNGCDLMGMGRHGHEDEMSSSVRRAMWSLPCLMALSPSTGQKWARSMIERTLWSLRARVLAGSRRNGQPMALYLMNDKGEQQKADMIVALLGINAWDCYRVTLDGRWFEGPGFMALSYAADYTEYQLLWNTSSSNSASPPADHAITVCLQSLVLQHAIEASRLLKKRGRSFGWMRALEKCARGSLLPLGPEELLFPHAEYNRGSPVEGHVEPYACLSPRVWRGLAEAQAREHLPYPPQGRLLENNLDYYSRLMEDDDLSVESASWEATLRGVLMLRNAEHAPRALALINRISGAVYPSMMRYGGHALSFLYAWTFLEALCGIRIRGATNEAGNTYESFGIDVFKAGSTVLPPPLSIIEITVGERRRVLFDAETGSVSSADSCGNVLDPKCRFR